MCDQIALMKEGKIVQLSEPERMYSDPVDSFVASFLGSPPISFLNVTVEGDSFTLPGNRIGIAEALIGKVGGQVQLGIRPENFGPQFGDGITGKVSFVETQGREDLYDITLPDGSILRSIQPAGTRKKLGDEVSWGVAVDKLFAFSAEGARL